MNDSRSNEKAIEVSSSWQHRQEVPVSPDRLSISEETSTSGAIADVDLQNVNTGFAIPSDGGSYVDEPPETPAPLFAVRAFKTAIFGTPHPYQKEDKPSAKPLAEEVQLGTKRRSEKPKEIFILERNNSPDGDNDAERKIAVSKPVMNIQLDPLVSPTKGILLTPGTAATRRKTVTFDYVQAKDQVEAKKPPNDTAVTQIHPVVETSEKKQDATVDGNPRQSTLTKTLIELSKQSSTKQASSRDTNTKPRKKSITPSIDFNTDSVLDFNADTTLDLSQPRSRSGQHWKTEYDQYHRRSNREMKKIIRYGQNVRSYAVKKDAEATILSEKLKKELAKVATMEAKVSRTATQLSNEQVRGSEGYNDATRLVSELTQQTALAISYKEKAEGYRRALSQYNKQDAMDNVESEDPTTEKPEGHEITVPTVDANAQSKESNVHTELQSLRANAKAAETQAAKLEKENAALKRSLARVKEEMMSYETRRQAREDRLKKREAKYKASSEESEKRLAQLTFEHQQLLAASGDLPIVDMTDEIRSIQHEAGAQGLHDIQEIPKTQCASDSNKENHEEHRNEEQNPHPTPSPRKKRLQNPTVDIWTLSSPRDTTENPSTSKEATQLPPSSVKHDIHRTLKEIDQNLTTKPASIKDNAESSPPKHLSSPQESAPAQQQTEHLSAFRQKHNRKSIINSPRPSMISLASSPAKFQPRRDVDQAYFKPSMATVGRSASMLSRAGGRTSTMTSGRGSAIPPDRAAAARQRLAKRSVEKKERQGSRERKVSESLN